MSLDPAKYPPALVQSLIFAAVAEIVCIGAGVFAWLQTDKIVWLVIGIVASLGFSLPTVIQLIRAQKGRD